MTTVAEAVETIRERLNERTASYWTDKQIRRWLNEAIQDMARRTFHYTDVDASISVVADDGEYLVPSNVIRINKAYFQPTSETIYIPLQARQWDGMDQRWGSQQNQTGGNPCMFTVRGYAPNLYIKLYPAPTLTGTLHLHVARMPATLDVTNGTGNIDTPVAWNALAYDYCEYMALLSERNPDWQVRKQLYEEKIGDMINNGDYLNAPGEVTWDGPYQYDSWLVGYNNGF